MTQTVLLGLCALACPVGMWFMMRGMNQASQPEAQDGSSAQPDLAAEQARAGIKAR